LLDAIQDDNFYASLHQQKEEEAITSIDVNNGEELTLLKALTAADDYVAKSEENDQNNGTDNSNANDDIDDVLSLYQNKQTASF